MDFEDLERQAWDDATLEYIQCLLNNQEVLMQALASRWFLPQWCYKEFE